MAKTSVQSAESSYFEAVTHFGLTHLVCSNPYLSTSSPAQRSLSPFASLAQVMEPFMIATENAFHDTHPVYKLLKPHFEGTSFMNQGAVDSLLARDGTIDKIFPPPIEVVWSIASAAARDWLGDINNVMFDVAFEQRRTGPGSKLEEYGVHTIDRSTERAR
jgi:arachidonate 15-lipoxygenase